MIENIVIGMTGSIGVLLVPHYVLLLRQSFVRNIHILMTRSAQRFITPYTMRLYSGNFVFTDSFQSSDRDLVPHISITDKAELFLIMPATADIIGKAAHGICDDLISTAIVASQAPVVFVPSMNQRMWYSLVVRKNVERLRELGYWVVEPGNGIEISDMQPTEGAMPTLESILKQINKMGLNLPK